MDRVLTIILFILIVNPLNGQVKDIAVGVTYQPFIYKNYNESDWNNRPLSYPVKPAHFNGFAIGAIAEKSLSDHFSLIGELTYSEQIQKHKSSNHSYDPNDEIELPYNIKINISFNMLKLPVSLAINTELGYNSKLFVQAYIGGQVSFLTYYRSTYRAFQITSDPPEFELEVNWDILVNEIIRTPRFSRQRFCSTCGFGDEVEYNIENNYMTDYLYNRLLLGVVGGFELRRIIFGDFFIGIGGRFEYDISNTDNTASDIQRNVARRTVYDSSSRGNSHNIRMGVSLSFVYLID